MDCVHGFRVRLFGNPALSLLCNPEPITYLLWTSACSCIKRGDLASPGSGWQGLPPAPSKSPAHGDRFVLAAMFGDSAGLRGKHSTYLQAPGTDAAMNYGKNVFL